MTIRTSCCVCVCDIRGERCVAWSGLPRAPVPRASARAQPYREISQCRVLMVRAARVHCMHGYSILHLPYRARQLIQHMCVVDVHVGGWANMSTGTTSVVVLGAMGERIQHHRVTCSSTLHQRGMLVEGDDTRLTMFDGKMQHDLGRSRISQGSATCRRGTGIPALRGAASCFFVQRKQVMLRVMHVTLAVEVFSRKYTAVDDQLCVSWCKQFSSGFDVCGSSAFTEVNRLFVRVHDMAPGVCLAVSRNMSMYILRINADGGRPVPVRRRCRHMRSPYHSIVAPPKYEDSCTLSDSSVAFVIERVNAVCFMDISCVRTERPYACTSGTFDLPSICQGAVALHYMRRKSTLAVCTRAAQIVLVRVSADAKADGKHSAELLSITALDDRIPHMPVVCSASVRLYTDWKGTVHVAVAVLVDRDATYRYTVATVTDAGETVSIVRQHVVHTRGSDCRCKVLRPEVLNWRTRILDIMAEKAGHVLRGSSVRPPDLHVSSMATE